MEASESKKPSGFRETVFTNCHDNFVRPEKPIVRRDLGAIENSHGARLAVNDNKPQSEFIPFNPKIQSIRNVNISTKKDEIKSNPKAKGECYIDIYRESKHYDVTDKPNKVKFLDKRFNEETLNRSAVIEPPKPAPMDKLARVDKIMNSSSMKSLLSGDANEKHLVKRSTVNHEALLQATRNCPLTHKKNSSYKHMVTSNGQIIYKD